MYFIYILNIATFMLVFNLYFKVTSIEVTLKVTRELVEITSRRVKDLLNK